ncbi:hypothetical protein B9G69_016835 [Bdellovibrio sp. SKB1291214]|uniref:hypothetical protein n=1 Tax=Bdellovibrio sp. SKB1291214 TaxID=1732569 RepID=UPI000B51529D|nr:hypothetical protein [Bdellovibrio sp. SKB1291214]UYL08710.1 hypothetical protein B9G69_016835 [Bdellovibrio sp. SKB1291214]
MKKLICSLIASLVMTSAAHAEISELYNAVRCRTEGKKIQIHFAVTKNQPLALYWIENDRVTVLSNQVQEMDHVVVGEGWHGLKHILNIDQGFYREVEKATGRVTKDVRGMECVFCPVEVDHCPGQFDNN